MGKTVTAAPADASVIAVCLNKVDADLLQYWVVLPFGLFVFALICATQISAAIAVLRRYSGKHHRRKAQHNPGSLILGGSSNEEPLRPLKQWCGRG